MIVLLATNRQQGEHYMRQMFPLESPRGSKHVKIVTDPKMCRGFDGVTFIKVGEFPMTDKDHELLEEARRCNLKTAEPSPILRGPER